MANKSDKVKRRDELINLFAKANRVEGRLYDKNAIVPPTFIRTLKFINWKDTSVYDRNYIANTLWVQPDTVSKSKHKALTIYPFLVKTKHKYTCTNKDNGKADIRITESFLYPDYEYMYNIVAKIYLKLPRNLEGLKVSIVKLIQDFVKDFIQFCDKWNYDTFFAGEYLPKNIEDVNLEDSEFWAGYLKHLEREALNEERRQQERIQDFSYSRKYAKNFETRVINVSKKAAKKQQQGGDYKLEFEALIYDILLGAANAKIRRYELDGTPIQIFKIAAKIVNAYYDYRKAQSILYGKGLGANWQHVRNVIADFEQSSRKYSEARKMEEDLKKDTAAA